MIERSKLHPLYPGCLSAIPLGSLSPSDLYSAVRSLPTWGDSNLDLIRLIDIHRECAARSSGRVGTDLMTVVVPRPPNDWDIQVRFVPDPAMARSQRLGLPELGSFGPWLIGPAKTVSPLDFVGIVRVPLGRFTVEMSGPEMEPFEGSGVTLRPAGPKRAP